jgi:aspartate racemase
MAVEQRGGLVGVLGGMGPAAGAYFAYRMVQLTSADCDQEHVPVLLRNDPRIPDRSAAKLRGGPSPLPAMLEGMRFLRASGAQCIAIPCNTAHIWYEELRSSVDVPVLHIVRSVIEDLQDRGVRGGRIGVMGTPATLRLGLYDKFLRDAAFEPIVPKDEEIERFCIEPIAAVKANRPGDALAGAVEGVRRLMDRGAVAVILGCTELPLAIPSSERAGLGICLTDSIDALALATLKACRRRVS